MKDIVISGTGLYKPPHVITNAELVEAFNAYAALQNEKNVDAIARGEVEPMVTSSVEFIEKASGIKQRYVIDKKGVLDPERMRPHFEPRPDEALSDGPNMIPLDELPRLIATCMRIRAALID